MYTQAVAFQNKSSTLSPRFGKGQRSGARLLAILLALFAFSSFALARAADLQTFHNFSIPAQPLDTALLAFSDQAKVQVLLWADAKSDAKSPGANGELRATEALKALLENTGLTYQKIDESTVAIRADGSTASVSDFPLRARGEGQGVKVAQATGDKSKGESRGFWKRLRLAQAEGDDKNKGMQKAQDENSSDSAKAEDENKLNEIIVTATKREERLQDIPMSIAVIGGQDIQRRGLIGMEDYLRSIPGVNQVDGGAIDNSIVMRGISSSPASENRPSSGAGTTVANFFGETPITGAGGMIAAAVDLRPVDIERIEVLRGPQGTAYGSASLSGALRTIPVQPRLDAFDVKIAASYSNTSGPGGDNSMVQGVVNIPVVADKFALRAVGYRFDESGFYHNIGGLNAPLLNAAQNGGILQQVTGFERHEQGRMVSTGGRVAGLWQATSELDVSLILMSQEIAQIGGVGATNFGKYDFAALPITPSARLHGEPDPGVEMRMNLANVVANYDLGWAKSTTTASWVHTVTDSASDFSNILPPLYPASDDSKSTFKSYTAETRLASKLEGRLQFLGGLYFEKLDEGFFQHAIWGGTAATLLTRYSSTDPMIARADIFRSRKQYAAFAEISYDLTEKLTATLGGRYYKYDKDQNEVRDGVVFGNFIGAGPINYFSNSEDGSRYKASLSYKPTRDMQVYATFSQGFRLGRPAIGLISANCDVSPADGIVDGTSISIESTRKVDSDSLDNYELGAKMALFDRRLIIDTAIYHIDWSKLPVRNIAPLPCGGSYTANAGAAESNGVEFQVSLFVVPDLRFDLGFGYTDAQLAVDAPNLTPPAHKGDQTPGSPKFNSNFSAQYDFDLAGRKAFVRMDSLYTGKFYGNFVAVPGSLPAGDYVKVDARAGIAFRQLRTELYVRNLTNEDAFTWRGVSTPLSPFPGYRLRPRTIGFEMGYSFK